jgi:hypothetical protein
LTLKTTEFFDGFVSLISNSLFFNSNDNEMNKYIPNEIGNILEKC